MSREVDERILSMRFDKDQFEKGVKETIKLLDEFEKELKFEGAEEGLKNISKAASKVDLSNLADSASVIEVKFSAMSIAVMTAISNIVTSAQQAGTRLIKALSFDQINAGFNKYTQKTAAVQTIMNATGKSVEETTAALAKLQWFSDETSYSFVDMTSNVGKFTSAGVELNTAISAMQGIANAAADAGSTTAEASRAMYNFSQALAKGYVQLIDWKSIENANMATLTFKQTIIDSAVALGTLIETQNGYVTAAKNSEVSASNFNESLKDGWFTTDVLLKALGKYSEYSDAIYDVADAFDTCAQAMAATSEEGMELGVRAFKAAQQAKTFTEAIDATKDAVSSGWMESFEIIFGNFNESVELWTGFTNTLWDVFASGAEARNAMLRGGLSTGWNQLLNDYIDDADSLKNVIISTAKEQEIAIDDLIASSGSFEKSLKEGWLTSDLFMKSLDNIISDFQNLSDAELSSKGYTEDTVKSIAKLKLALDNGSISVEDLTKSLAKQSGRENIIQGLKNAYDALLSVIVPVKEAINNIFPPMTSERLYELTERFKDFTAQLGLSEDGAEGLKRIVQDLLIPFRMLWEILKGGARFFGYLALSVFKIVDAFIALRAGGGPIPGLLKKIFGEERYNRLTEALAKIVERLANSFSKLKSSTVNFYNKLKDSKGANKALTKISDVLKNIGSGMLEGIVRLFEALANIDFSKFSSSVSGGFRAVIDWIKTTASSLFDFQNLSEKVSAPFKKLFDIFKDTSESSDDMSKSVDNMKNSFKPLGDKLKGLGENLLDFIRNIDLSTIAVAAFGTILIIISLKIIEVFDSIATIIQKSASIVAGVNTFISNINKTFKTAVIAQIASSVALLAASIIALSFVDAKKMWRSLGAIVILLAAMTGSFELLAYTIGKNDKIVANISKFSTAIFALSGSVAILAVALKLLTGTSFDDVINGIAGIGLLLASMYAFMLAIQNIKVEKVAKAAGFIISFGAAIILMSIAIKKLSKIDYTSISGNIPVIFGILSAFAVIAKMLDGATFKGGAGLLLVVTSLFLFISALKKLAKQDPDILMAGLLKFIPLLAAVSAIFLASRLAGQNAAKSAVLIIAIGVSMQLLAKGIKQIAGLSIRDIAYATIVLVSLGIVVSGIMRIMDTTEKAYKGVGSLGLFAIGLSAAVLVLSIAIKYLGKIGGKELAKGTAAVLSLMALFALVLYCAKDTQKATASIVAIAVVIGALVVALALLSGIKTEKLAKAVITISAALFSLSVVFKSLKEIKFGAAIGQALSMGMLFGAVVASLIVLDGLNVEGLITKAAALSMIILSLSTVIAALSLLTKSSNSKKKSVGFAESFKAMIASIIPVIAILGIAIGALAIMDAADINASIDKVATLSLLVIALSTAAAIMGYATKKVGGSTKSIKAAAAIAIEVAALGVTAAGALWMIQNVDGAIEKAAALSFLIVALSASAAIIGESTRKLGGSKKRIQAALSTSLEIVALGITAAASLAMLNNVDASIEKAASLSLVIVALAGTAALLTTVKVDPKAVGSGAVAILEIAGVIALIVGAIGLIAGVIGALDKEGTLADTIDRGMETLSAITRGIGDVIGSFVAGLGEGLTSTLPEIGQNIGDFGVNAKPFFDTLSSVDGAAALGAVTALVECLLGLTANDMLTRINELFGGETTTLEGFGRDLKKFGRAFVEFSGSLEGIDESAVTKMAVISNLAKALSEATPTTGGVISWFKGNKQDLGTFGESLKEFAQGFMGFYEEVTKDGIIIDTTVVESVTNAGLMLSGLNDNLPETGGVLQKWLGSKSLGNWGENLAIFGSGFAAFYNAIDGLEVDSKLITSITNAADGFAKINEKIPPTDGVLQAWLGHSSLASWGGELATFGQMFVDFYETIKELKVDQTQVDSVTNAAKTIASLDEVLPEEPGKFEKWFGGGNISFGEFGEQLKQFGTGFIVFYAAIKGFAGGEDISGSVDRMVSLISDVNAAIIETSGYDASKFAQMTSFGVALEEFGKGLKEFYNAVSNLNTIDGVDILAELQNSGGSLVSSIVVGIVERMNDLRTAGQHCIEAFEDGLGSVDTSEFGSFADEFITYVVNTLGTANGRSVKFEAAGVRSVLGFRDGINDGFEQVRTKIQEFTKMVTDELDAGLGINSPSKKFREAAEYCIQGFVLGLKKNSNQAYSGVSVLSGGILNRFRNDFKIQSPSQVMRDEVGRYIVQGIAEGITGDMSAIDAAKQMASNIVNAFKDQLDTFSLDQTTFDLEYQLWEAYNSTASESEIAEKKIETLSNKMTAQAERVVLAEAQYKATVQALGEQSEQAQEAYNSFLQEQISMAQYAKEMLELQGNTVVIDKETARQNYKEAIAFVNEYRDTMLASMSDEAIEEYLNSYREAYYSGGSISGSTVEDIVNSYMSKTKNVLNGYGESVEVVLDTNLSDAMANALVSAGRSSSNAAYSAGVRNGEDYLGGVNDALSEFSLGGLFKNLIGGDESGTGTALGESAGSNVIDGVVSKVQGAGKWLGDAGKSIYNYLDKGFRDEAEINSPSKRMRRNGEHVIQGLINGINSEAPALENASISAFSTINSATDAIDSAIFKNTIDDMIKNGTDSLIKSIPYMNKAGSYVISRFADSVGGSEGSYTIQDAFTSFTDSTSSSFIDIIREKLYLPFYQFGQMMTQALSDGTVSNMEEIEDTAATICDAVIDAISAASDDDYQIVITPVIDSAWKDDLEDFYDTVLQFDKNGNLVPYGTYSPSNAWVKTDRKTASAAREAAKIVNRRATSTPWRDYDSSEIRFADDLLQRLYNEAQENKEYDAENVYNNTYNNYTYNQTNTSPKALSTSEIYRQSKNLFSNIKGG